MKRSKASGDQDSQPKAKRVKGEKNLLFSLARDELSVVTSFCTVGEVLMMSLTCKYLYETVVDMAISCQPCILDDKPWSLSQALLADEKVVLKKNEHLEQLQKHLGASRRVNHLVLSQLKVDLLLSILSQPITEEAEERTMDIIKIKAVDDGIRTSFQDETDSVPTKLHDVSSERVKVTKGSFIEKLSLDLATCSRNTLYRLLSACPNIQDLRIELTDDYSPSDIQKHSEIIVPLLKQLKRMNMQIMFDMETANACIGDLLQLCPNLEHLIYVYGGPPGDKFMNFLSTCCPKLQSLFIQGYDGATPLSCIMTDKGIEQFLEAQKHLTSLQIQNCGSISGELWTKIGKFSTLKTLNVQRSNAVDDLVDEFEGDEDSEEHSGIYFGGGVMTAMESFAMDGDYQNINENTLTTLAKTMPNLKSYFSCIHSNNGQNPNEEILIANCQKLEDLCIYHPSDSLLQSLAKKKMKRIVFNNRIEPNSTLFTTSFLNSCQGYWNNLEHFSCEALLPDNLEEWIDCFVELCPNLEHFEYDDPSWNDSDGPKKRKRFGEKLLQVLSDGKWPNLRSLVIRGIQDEQVNYHGVNNNEIRIHRAPFVKIRPLLFFSNDREAFSEKFHSTAYQHVPEEIMFMRKWLFREKIDDSASQLNNRFYIE